MSTATLNKGRFGYYTTDYETYRKLKYLHKCYWETVYAVGRWVRWSRKTVNQGPIEPKYFDLFVDDKFSYKTFTNKDGFQETKAYPKTLNDRGIIEAYQTARMPVATPEEVQELKYPVEEINRKYELAKAFFG